MTLPSGHFQLLTTWAVHLMLSGCTPEPSVDTNPTPTPTAPTLGPADWSGELTFGTQRLSVAGVYQSWMAAAATGECLATEHVSFVGQEFTLELLQPLGTGELSDDARTWTLPIPDDDGELAMGRVPATGIILLPGDVFPNMAHPPQVSVVGGTLRVVGSLDESRWTIDIDARLACFVDMANSLQCVDSPEISLDLTVSGVEFAGLGACIWEADPSVTVPGEGDAPLCARRQFVCASEP